jgi:hypothetical protein
LELPFLYICVVDREKKKERKIEREKGGRGEEGKEADGERKEEETVGNQEEEGKLEKKASFNFKVSFPFPFPHACRNLMNLELCFHLGEKRILGFYEIE